ncbi:hemin uptake protein HemP [Lysobacter terrae]
MPLRPVLHLVNRPLRNEVLSPPAAHASVESNALLRGTRELLIRHGNEVYRLRHTRNDKLILTK